jgi:peptidyl-prolyl cis-trans isomerase D
MFLFERLRKNTKIILWITVFAFVGFIFLVWGMDVQRSSGPNPTVIGSVNGQRIPTSYFRDMLSQAYEQARQETGGRITDTQELRLRQMTWDRVVNEVLLQQELRRRNLKVTDEELAYYIRYSPPPEVAQNPAFQTDGQFDPAKYREILTNPAYDLSGLEALVRTTMPLRKLEELIILSVKVSDNEVRAYFEDVSQKVDFSYVLARPGAFYDKSDTLSEQELRVFYDADPEQFRLEESAKLRYMVADKKPSATDESDALTTANDIWRDARAGGDFAELAATFSEGPEAVDGGLIKTLAGRGDVAPEFTDVAFSLNVGEISSPFKDSKGFNIMKLEEKRVVGGVEKVRYRRIFIPVEPSAETLGEIHAAVLEAIRKASKETFEQVGREAGFEVRETDVFYKGGILPVLPNSEIAQAFPFSHKIGAISKPIEAQRAWYVLQVAERRDSYVPSFEEALPAVRRAATQAKLEELARRKVEALASTISEGAGLEQAARLNGLSVEKMTSVGRADVGFEPGREPIMIGAAFALSVGQTSPVLKGNAGFFIVRLDARPPVPEELFVEQRDQMRAQLLQQKRMIALSLWMEQLRNSAKIEDYRAELGM